MSADSDTASRHEMDDVPVLTNLTLSEARRQRKQVELDVQALENRISMLAKEEVKARKRITQTKGRAKEILHLRKDNEERRKGAMQLNSRNSVDIHSVQERYVEKQLARAAKEKQLIKTAREKRAQAKQFRVAKRVQEKAMVRDRQETHQHAMEMRSKIRQQKFEAQVKIEKQKNAVKLQGQVDYFRRIEQEKLKAKEVEAVAAALGERELQLIDRLQSTQRLQREAYNRLEDALCSNGGGETTQPSTTNGESSEYASEGGEWRESTQDGDLIGHLDVGAGDE